MKLTFDLRFCLKGKGNEVRWFRSMRPKGVGLVAVIQVLVLSPPAGMGKGREGKNSYAEGGGGRRRRRGQRKQRDFSRG
jgi:hypothetical protein